MWPAVRDHSCKNRGPRYILNVLAPSDFVHTVLYYLSQLAFILIINTISTSLLLVFERLWSKLSLHFLKEKNTPIELSKHCALLRPLFTACNRHQRFLNLDCVTWQNLTGCYITLQSLSQYFIQLPVEVAGTPIIYKYYYSGLCDITKGPTKCNNHNA